MRAGTAFVLLAAVAGLACGGDSTPITGTGGGGGGGGGGGIPKAPDLNARVNELLAEINSSQTAIGKGGGGGGAAANRLPIGGPTLSPLGRASADLTIGHATFDAAPADNAALCVLDTATVTWGCPPQTLQSGLVNKVSFQFLDATNAPQMHFDTVTTAAIRRVSDLIGTISQPVQTQNGPVPATQTSDHHEDVVLTGLHAESHVQNGTGTMTQTIAMEGRDTAFITAPTTTTGILSSPKVPYPVGGSYTAVVHTVQGPSTSTTTQVTSFDGTTVARLVITFVGGKQRVCTYDMTSQTPPTCTGP